MNIKVTSNIVKNLGKEFTPIQSKTGTLLGTYTKEGVSYIEIKVNDLCWEIPRKYCVILVGKSLTNELK